MKSEPKYMKSETYGGVIDFSNFINLSQIPEKKGILTLLVSLPSFFLKIHVKPFGIDPTCHTSSFFHNF
jgi:hypothetical protein